VDIGNPASEAGYVMTSWAALISPGQTGGNYGGIDDCRAIWSSSDNSRNATIDLMFAGGVELVSFKHLEGLADDGFKVYIDRVTNPAPVYTHVESTTTELWFVSGFFTNQPAGLHTVEFEATGAQWSGWATYGQVCFSDIWVGPGGPIANEKTAWGNLKALYR
jgi:hypothetical protein